MYGKRITFHSCKALIRDLRKPRDPEDQAFRKLFVGNMNAATNRAAVQSYFQKFGEVERCYRTLVKETNKYGDYGFVVFRAAATADEVQRARPHTLMGHVVSTQRAVSMEEKGNPEAEMRSKKLYITSIHGPNFGLNKDTSNSDLEEYFSKYGQVVCASQEREMGSRNKKGSGYIDFSDEDPVDRAVLMGVHYIKTAVLKAKRVLSRRQQQEVRRKQEHAGIQR